MIGILVYKENPDIVEAVLLDHYPDNEIFYLDNLTMPIAFGVHSYLTSKPRNDPAYVEWQAYLQIKNSDGFKAIPLKLHICTDEDFEEFYDSSKASTDVINQFKFEKSMVCLDKNQ